METRHHAPAVLFVCTGNICRSPAAEGVLAALVHEAGLADRILVESAGTIGYHAGELADPRMRRAASARGYELTSRARQFRPADFAEFSHIVALDRGHKRQLLALARTPEERSRVRLMMDYHPHTPGADVPDPYYGGPEDFELVLDLLEAACPRLLAEVTSAAK